MRRIVLQFALAASLCFWVIPVWGQPAAPPENADQQATNAANPDHSQPLSDPAAEFQRLLTLARTLEPQPAVPQVKLGDIPQQPTEQSVLTLLEVPHFAHYFIFKPGDEYRTPEAHGCFLARLSVVNLTPLPVNITRPDITVRINGTAHTVKDVPKHIQLVTGENSFQGMALVDLPLVKELTCAPGSVATGWVFVADLPLIRQTMPQVKLQITHSEQQATIDVTAQQRRLLGLEIKTVGPRKELALLRVSGQFNMINLPVLVEELERLAAQKVTRAVLSFSPGTGPVEPFLKAWLRSMTLASRENDDDDSYALVLPVIPGGIEEFHLTGIAHIPVVEANSVYPAYEVFNSEWSPAIHETEAAAVIAALKATCRSLSQSELLVAMQTGEISTRAAALTWGASRITPDLLPLLLRMADDSHPDLRAAAIKALGESGEPAAHAKLVSLANGTDEAAAKSAIASLADSRFPRAQQELLQVLQTAPAAIRVRMVTILARYPRPLWNETLYTYAKMGPADLRQAALRALVRTGHPQLLELLDSSLRDANPEISQLAFELLTRQPGSKARGLAANYALARLENGGLNEKLLLFLVESREPRAIPFLLRALPMSDHSGLILEALSVSADQRIEAPLLTQYPKLKTAEQARVLRMLMDWGSARFDEFAGPALMSADPVLVEIACEGMIRTARTTDVALLAKALQQNPEQATFHHLSEALGLIGSPAAREALMLAQTSENPTKQQASRYALQMIRKRSLAIPRLLASNELMKTRKWEPALREAEQAIKLDPDLPEAQLAKAHVLVRLNQMDEAYEAYLKGYELDRFHPQAITGVAIGKVLKGDVEEGIKLVETERARFSDDSLFLYNVACAYGRALEVLDKQTDFPNREALQQQYTAAALKDIKRAIVFGFSEQDWIKADPDLAALHENTEFKRLVEADWEKIQEAGLAE